MGALPKVVARAAMGDLLRVVATEHRMKGEATKADTADARAVMEVPRKVSMEAPLRVVTGGQTKVVTEDRRNLDTEVPRKAATAQPPHPMANQLAGMGVRRPHMEVGIPLNQDWHWLMKAI